MQLKKSHFEEEYPLHGFDNLFYQLKGVRIYSKIYLRLGYHEVRKMDEDINKNNFHNRIRSI